MATDRQIEANRRNAQKSTGPKPTEGNRRAKPTHGSTGSQQEQCSSAPSATKIRAFEEMRNELMDSWQPVGMKETQLVEMIAGAYARMQRLEKIESGYMDGALATMQRRFGLPDTPTGEDDFGCGIAHGRRKTPADIRNPRPLSQERMARLRPRRPSPRGDAEAARRNRQSTKKKRSFVKPSARRNWPKSVQPPPQTGRIRNRRHEFRRIGFVPGKPPQRLRDPLRTPAQARQKGRRANLLCRIRSRRRETNCLN